MVHKGYGFEPRRESKINKLLYLKEERDGLTWDELVQLETVRDDSQGRVGKGRVVQNSIEFTNLY